MRNIFCIIIFFTQTEGEMAQTPHQNVNFSSIPKTHSDIKIWYCCFCFNYNQDTKASRLPYFFLRCTGHCIHPNSWLRRTHFFPLNVVRRTGPIHLASLWKCGSHLLAAPSVGQREQQGSPRRSTRGCPWSCRDLAAIPAPARPQPSLAICAFLQESRLFG